MDTEIVYNLSDENGNLLVKGGYIKHTRGKCDIVYTKTDGHAKLLYGFYDSKLKEFYKYIHVEKYPEELCKYEFINNGDIEFYKDSSNNIHIIPFFDSNYMDYNISEVFEYEFDWSDDRNIILLKYTSINGTPIFEIRTDNYKLVIEGDIEFKKYKNLLIFRKKENKKYLYGSIEYSDIPDRTDDTISEKYENWYSYLKYVNDIIEENGYILSKTSDHYIYSLDFRSEFTYRIHNNNTGESIYNFNDWFVGAIELDKKYIKDLNLNKNYLTSSLFYKNNNEDWILYKCDIYGNGNKIPIKNENLINELNRIALSRSEKDIPNWNDFEELPKENIFKLSDWEEKLKKL